MNDQFLHDELPPILSELQGRGDGYQSPPDAYFHKLADQIMQNAEAPAKKSSTPVRKINRWITYAAAAAIILAISWTTLLWVDMNQGESGNNDLVTTDWEDEIDQLADDEILDYIDANIQDFELELLSLESVEHN